MKMDYFKEFEVLSIVYLDVSQYKVKVVLFHNLKLVSDSWN